MPEAPIKPRNKSTAGSSANSRQAEAARVARPKKPALPKVPVPAGKIKKAVLPQVRVPAAKIKKAALPKVPKAAKKRLPAKTPLLPKAKKRLPVLEVQGRTQVGCLTCGLCCTYIAVGIDGPKNAKLATEILWHLYHHGVSVYRDGENEWMVQFESRCRHLQDDNKCAIYDKRPHICRAYSEQSCEVNAEGTGTTFYTPEQFLSYLAKRHKRVYQAIADTHVPGAESLGRVAPPRRKYEPFEAQFARLRALGDAGGLKLKR